MAVRNKVMISGDEIASGSRFAASASSAVGGSVDRSHNGSEYRELHVENVAADRVLVDPGVRGAHSRRKPVLRTRTFALTTTVRSTRNRSGMTARHLVAGGCHRAAGRRYRRQVAPCRGGAARAILEMGLETHHAIARKPLFSLASPGGFEPPLPP